MLTFGIILHIAFYKTLTGYDKEYEEEAEQLEQEKLRKLEREEKEIKDNNKDKDIEIFKLDILE